MKQKLKNKKGFTLVELLVVVAIIAILVVISIPLVNTSLEGAKEAADDANLRAAKAVAVLGTIGAEGGITDPLSGTKFFYDISEGELSTGTPQEDDKPQSTKNSGKDSIVVQIKDGNVESVAWGTYSST